MYNDLKKEQNSRLKNISFNGLKLGDDATSSSIILDSNYYSLNNVLIKEKDGKITCLLIQRLTDSNNKVNVNIKTEKIMYNDKKLETINDFISTFGEYDREIIYHKSNQGMKIYIYEENIQDRGKFKTYTLTILIKDKIILNVELIEN